MKKQFEAAKRWAEKMHKAILYRIFEREFNKTKNLKK